MADKLHQLIIFEGPDCGGKSTVLFEVKKKLGANCEAIHHGPFTGVSADQLPRFYVESMFGLFAGQGSLVMDRCWLSEPIYGRAFRSGQDRVGIPERRQLERMALRHGAVVVLCLPPWEAVKQAWLTRKGADSEAEYLDNLEQLKSVYDDYDKLEEVTDLPVVRYDYTVHSHHLDKLMGRINKASTGVHADWWKRTAGSADPKVIVVGDKPSNPTSRDTVWQFPFCSFGSGSSTWLTDHLYVYGISERDIFWTNSAGSQLHGLKEMWSVPIIALGNEAAEQIEKDLGRPADHIVAHPQYHKRFKSSEQYRLGELIESIIK